MVDPITLLAFSMHKYRGVYALLLGSGISRSARVPTGWEVVLDLTRQLARAQGEGGDVDPITWYRQHFGEEPDYSKLLNQIAKSPTERAQLLRPYFEPRDEDERRQGSKVPTPAHRAIAQLVADGHVRVIITTNFDRLLEQALESVGVTPSVISTADDVNGALPIVHARCTVVKVHGDYLDTRIKNTSEELAGYDSQIDALLDRVFDDFGLIVCGWSAEWDEALRAALMRCPNRRFTTFWTSRGELQEHARLLTAQRQAEVLQIRDADTFFVELKDQITALDAFERPHPLSASVVAETVKRYIEDDKPIRLRDVIMGEVERLHSAVTEKAFPLQGIEPTGELLQEQLTRYEVLASVTLAALILGGYWGSRTFSSLFAQAIERLYMVGPRRSDNTLFRLAKYPALLAFYGTGIAAIAGRHYDLLADIFLWSITDEFGNRHPLVRKLLAPDVLSQGDGRTLPEANGQLLYTPLNDHLSTVLQRPFEELLSEHARYEWYFDRFEYLLGLVHVDLDLDDHPSTSAWGPPGRFAWKRAFLHDALPELEAEIGREGEDWPPLRAGLFGGSIERLDAARNTYNSLLRSLGWWR